MAQNEGPGAGEENDGLHRPLNLSEELSEVVGDGPMGRADVVSGLWDYIKKNDLQDGQEIKADDKLKAVFGKERFTMFEMNEILSDHLQEAD
ncbi:chromatin remodeling complex protein RSC6 [Brevundimonas alba]|uniref:Chromatin remodeling complex protein RSC6 n=1 Tax=Brevundimonas alba TaxID=74314 RepID=A0A7X6BLV0_9CAUL|nr:SWIB/MDM2 domain-containing protein [Brevundimonas alba]NJC40343.1 chromatin remodeling complex protein RSC6 [Brevundimonas alba]